MYFLGWKLSNSSFTPLRYDSVQTLACGDASCARYPCEAGQQCRYDRFSRVCQPCAAGTGALPLYSDRMITR